MENKKRTAETSSHQEFLTFKDSLHCIDWLPYRLESVYNLSFPIPSEFKRIQIGA
jgi:hypothetical protein